MAVQFKQTPVTSLHLLPDLEPTGTEVDLLNPDEWLARNTYPDYTDEQTLSFLSLYIRTHRDDLHPILMEALIYYGHVLTDDMAISIDDMKIKGKGPRGRHAPKKG